MAKFEIKGMKELQARLKTIKPELLAECNAEIEAGCMEWVRLAKTDAPGDMGYLRSQISYEKVEEGRFNIVSAAMYAGYMEFGTKGKYKPIPGTEAIAAELKGSAPKGSLTLFQAILQWVKRKGIAGTYSTGIKKSKGGFAMGKSKGKRTGSKSQQEKENETVAFLIARSIYKNGVTPHPYFFKQADIVWPGIIRRLVNRIERSTGVTVILPGGINRPSITTI